MSFLPSEGLRVPYITYIILFKYLCIARLFKYHGVTSCPPRYVISARNHLGRSSRDMGWSVTNMWTPNFYLSLSHWDNGYSELVSGGSNWLDVGSQLSLNPEARQRWWLWLLGECIWRGFQPEWDGTLSEGAAALFVIVLDPVLFLKAQVEAATRCFQGKKRQI